MQLAACVVQYVFFKKKYDKDFSLTYTQPS